MFFVSIALLAGIVLGWFFRNKSKLRPISEKITSILIFLLLFALGLSLSMQREIMKNLSVLGIKSITLGAGAVIGSLVAAYLIHEFFFRKNQI